MYLPVTDLLLFYALVGFYIFPIFIIAGVLVLPAQRNTYIYSEAESVPLAFMSAYGLIFCSFLYAK